MSKRPRYVLRTVHEGRVRIKGAIFEIRPCNATSMPYDGRLDGLRMAFGLYWNGPEWHDKYVDIWGTEKAYRDQSDRGVDWPGPHCVDGSFPWVADLVTR